MVISRCLPNQLRFYCDKCSNRNDNPCIISPHAQPLRHGTTNEEMVSILFLSLKVWSKQNWTLVISEHHTENTAVLEKLTKLRQFLNREKVDESLNTVTKNANFTNMLHRRIGDKTTTEAVQQEEEFQQANQKKMHTYLIAEV